MTEQDTARGVLYDGFPSRAEIAASPGVPSPSRLASGPVAFIECVQEIPCNPCEAACPRGAITVGLPVTNLPRFDGERCTGCGLCIPKCPGLAIFLIDMTFAPDKALVEFPYEYLPLPSKGDVVGVVDRSGKVIGRGEVVRVLVSKAFDGTAVVGVAVSKELAMDVRSIARRKHGDGK